MALHNLKGSAAEDEVSKYLENQGYKIIDKNWKTKWCEVDVIAKKDECIFFVEVKYRESALQGSGFDYITDKKLNQMARAADSWVMLNKWNGEYNLSAAEVSGPNYKIEFIPQI